MTRAVSNAVTIEIKAPGALPASGYAKIISPAEAFQAVRPAGMTADNWRYSLFGSFGSGCFNPYYSASGAYIFACSGGHDHPCFFGAAVFDFGAQAWDYLPCANAGMPFDMRNGSINATLTSQAPYWEMLGVTDAEVPSPPHAASSQLVLAPAQGGSAKGSMVYIGRYSVDSVGGANSGTVHAFDLVARKWSRKSGASVGGGNAISADGDVVFDPVALRYYVLPYNLHNWDYVLYWNAVSGVWEQSQKQNSYINDSGYASAAAFVHEGGGVRALILTRRDAWLANGDQCLAGLDLNNQSVGWTRKLSLTGVPIPNINAKWAYHAAQNVYYRRDRTGMGQTLYRLTPPTGNPITGTWNHDVVTLQGDVIPEAVGAPLTNYGGYRSLMYIPAIQMLGWVTAQGVALINP